MNVKASVQPPSFFKTCQTLLYSGAVHGSIGYTFLTTLGYVRWIQPRPLLPYFAGHATCVGLYICADAVYRLGSYAIGSREQAECSPLRQHCWKIIDATKQVGSKVDRCIEKVLGLCLINDPIMLKATVETFRPVIKNIALGFFVCKATGSVLKASKMELPYVFQVVNDTKFFTLREKIKYLFISIVMPWYLHAQASYYRLDEKRLTEDFMNQTHTYTWSENLEKIKQGDLTQIFLLDPLILEVLLTKYQKDWNTLQFFNVDVALKVRGFLANVKAEIKVQLKEMPVKEKGTIPILNDFIDKKTLAKYPWLQRFTHRTIPTMWERFRYADDLEDIQPFITFLYEGRCPLYKLNAVLNRLSKM